MRKLSAPLILASGSPRRKQLLEGIGLSFTQMQRPTDESFPEGMAPTAVAEYVATHKARQFEDLAPTHIILTADTLVVLGEEILAKPADEAEAHAMLRKLSGSTHEVITGCCLFHQGRCHSFAETTEVGFRELSEEEIAYYVRSYRPFDKAGAYGIQEWIGMVGITSLRGDYYNVMGLPLARLYAVLGEQGFWAV